MEASALSEYTWMDWIVSGFQQYQQAGVPSSSPTPPPPPPHLAPSHDQNHGSLTHSPPPPPPPPAPRLSVHPYHAHQNSTNVHPETSSTSNNNLVRDSLMLELLGAYQKFEEMKISGLVEQRKSLEKQLDTIKEEIETRTRRLDEMEFPHSVRQTYRGLDFAPPLRPLPQHYVPPPPPPPPERYVPPPPPQRYVLPPPPPPPQRYVPPPPPLPQRLWHYNPSPPPSIAPQHLWQHTIPIPPPLPPPNRGLMRGNSGVLKNIMRRQSFD